MLTGGQRLCGLGQSVQFSPCIVICLSTCALDVENVSFACPTDTEKMSHTYRNMRHTQIGKPHTLLVHLPVLFDISLSHGSKFSTAVFLSHAAMNIVIT